MTESTLEYFYKFSNWPKYISLRQQLSPVLNADNTNFLCKGKYHCTDVLLFDWFGIHQTSKSVTNLILTKLLLEENALTKFFLI